MRTAFVAVAALAASVLTACGTGVTVGRDAGLSAPFRTPAPTTASATTPAAPPAQAVHRPKPPPNYCAHNTAPQLIVVKLAVQHMWLCHRSRTVYSNPITSGMLGPDTHTPTGHYRIQGLNRNSVLTINTGATYDVKYWIPFDAPLFGFHDSSWQHFPYGSPKYKTNGSHGCIHMPLKAIEHLYHWADIGAAVSIS